MRQVNKRRANREAAAKQIERLQYLLTKGEKAKATDLARKLTRRHPGHSLPWKTLAISFADSGDQSKALTFWQNALQLDPDAADTHCNMGSIFRSSGNLEAAEKHCSRAVELAPNYAEAHLSLGMVQQDLKQYDKAGVSYENASRLKPSLFEAIFNLGLIKEHQNRPDEANECYLRVLAINPLFPPTYYQLANTQVALNQPKEAIENFRKAISLEPRYVEARNNLGVTLQKLGRWSEAVDCYMDILSMAPESAEIYFNLGRSMEGAKNLLEAERHYSKALEINDDFFRAQNNLGLVRLRLNYIHSAVQNLEKAVDLEPNIAEPHCNLAIALYAEGRIEESLALASKACALDENFAFASLVKQVLKSRATNRKSSRTTLGQTDTRETVNLSRKHLILERPIESGLVNLVCSLKSRKMDDARNTPVFGNGSCSPGYNFFDDSNPLIKRVHNDLVAMLRETFNSEIFIYDSFFNIYNEGSGIPPHDHLNEMDTVPGLRLGKQKFSMVYYLDVGDQRSQNPGRLELYEPSYEILPSNGLIVLFSADRQHSATYSGTSRRVVIGVNFYVI